MSQKKHLRRMQRRIREFDLCSLIRALEGMGIKRREIFFESNPQNTSPKSLCESIAFFNESPKVRIVLNMGLLGAHSPMPSYFQKMVDAEEIDPQRFLRYIGFFNHLLIQEHLRLTLPERNKNLFANWRETHFHYLSLLGFESISTLWLLVASSFPELTVNITKNPRMVRHSAATLVLGRDGLGPFSFIGERLDQTLSSFKITITTEEEVSELGSPWPVEVNQRLSDWLFPTLKKTDLHLSIVLLIKHKVGHMHLSASHSLGFDRIGQIDSPFQLLLFHGYVKEFQRSRFLA